MDKSLLFKLNLRSSHLSNWFCRTEYNQVVLANRIIVYLPFWVECTFQILTSFWNIVTNWWLLVCKESRRISGLIGTFGLFCRCFPHLLIVGKPDQQHWEAVSSVDQVRWCLKSEPHILMLWYSLVEKHIKYFNIFLHCIL